MSGIIFALAGVFSAKTTAERVCAGDFLAPAAVVAVGGALGWTREGVVQAIGAGVFAGSVLALPGSVAISVVDRWTGSRRFALLSGVGVTLYWVNYLHQLFHHR